MRQFWNRILARKSPVFWSMVTFFVGITLFVIIQLGRNYLPWLAQEILPRIPNLNNNIEIRLEVKNPTNVSVQSKLETFKVGTSVYRFQPKLEVLGFVKDIQIKSDHVLFLLSISAKYKDAILCDTTKFELLQSSPSMIMIFQRFFEGPNAQQFKQEMKRLAENNQSKISIIFLRLTQILGSKIKNEQQAKAILEDPQLKAMIYEQFREQITTKIDLQELWDKLEQNPHAKHTVEIFQKNIDWKKVKYRAIAGAGSQALEDASTAWLDPKMVFDDPNTAAKALFSVMNFIIDPSTTTKRGTDALIPGATKAAVKATAKEAGKIAKENFPEILESGSEAAINVLTETQTPQKIWEGLLNLSKNKQIREYTQKRYGSKVTEAISQTFIEASNDPQIVTNFNTIVSDIQNITTGWLEKFLLDETHSGPNPLLLVAIREGISQKIESQIVCYPGENGRRVSSENIFVTIFQDF